MAQKREFDGSDDRGFKRRRDDGYRGNRNDDDNNREQENASSWAKKRVRNIERLLDHKKDSLPRSTHDELQRELIALRNDLENRKRKKERSRMIQKYHMLRFFERKKAQRLEKQLKKRLEETDDPAERETLARDAHVAAIDRLYALYFPFLEPYVSLYPGEGKGEKKGKKDKKGKKEKDDKDDKNDKKETEDANPQSKAAQALQAPRPPMWKVIEETMETGGITALEQLRDRQPESELSQQEAKKGKVKAEVKSEGKSEAKAEAEKLRKAEKAKARAEKAQKAEKAKAEAEAKEEEDFVEKREKSKKSKAPPGAGDFFA